MMRIDGVALQPLHLGAAENPCFTNLPLFFPLRVLLPGIITKETNAIFYRCLLQ